MTKRRSKGGTIVLPRKPLSQTLLRSEKITHEFKTVKECEFCGKFSNTFIEFYFDYNNQKVFSQIIACKACHIKLKRNKQAAKRL